MEENKQEVKPTTEASSVVTAAESLAQRLEEANKRSEQLLRENEALLTKQLLGGKSSAGAQAPAPKEETPLEYARRISAGRL